jgi:glucosamine-6-phosphate deaminase
VTDVRVFADATALGDALAAEIVAGIQSARDQGRDYLLGCPGGRSPRSTYAALAHEVHDRRLDLSHVVIVMMDDYVVRDGASYARVPATMHCSVERFARVEILAPLNAAAGAGRGIPDASLWIPDPQDPAAYDDLLAAAGGVDLFILATGDSDGHVAFNPPGAPRDSRTRVIELAESTRRDNLGTFPEFTHLENVPRYGISVGIATIIDHSQRAVLVAPGASKRRAVAHIAAASGYDPAWPATVVAACRAPSLYADELSVQPAEVAQPPTRAPHERNEVHT